MTRGGAPRPTCKVCHRRIRLLPDDGWVHLPTVAGVEAEADHRATVTARPPGRPRRTR